MNNQVEKRNKSELILGILEGLRKLDENELMYVNGSVDTLAMTKKIRENYLKKIS
jgi:hypothetical protein|nr:MAG TPA: hypothetical protein [Caudoviricetes sp.]